MEEKRGTTDLAWEKYVFSEGHMVGLEHDSLRYAGVAHLGGNQKAALSGWALKTSGRLPPFAQKRKVLYGMQCSSK